MNDQQLKIRIKLNQLPDVLEPESPEEIDVESKPPFDRRKIALAILSVVILLSVSLYWLLADKESSTSMEAFPAVNTNTEVEHSIENRDQSSDVQPGPNVASENKGNPTPDTLSDTAEVIPHATPTDSGLDAATQPPHSIIPARKPERIESKTFNQIYPREQVIAAHIMDLVQLT